MVIFATIGEKIKSSSHQFINICKFVWSIHFLFYLVLYFSHYIPNPVFLKEKYGKEIFFHDYKKIGEITSVFFQLITILLPYGYPFLLYAFL